MTTTLPIDGSYQEPDDYRDTLVYRQEYGYKLVIISIGLASNERSHATSHVYNLPVPEDAEHLQEVDLYQFSVTDGTQIQLIIDTPTGSKEACYTVRSDALVAERSPINMTIVCSDESVPLDYAYTQEALDEALNYYADQIPGWLNETLNNIHLPDYELDDFRC